MSRPADVDLDGPRVGRSKVLLAVVVAGLALTLAVHTAPWVTEGFGVSHEGYNGAMWGLGARAGWDDPIGSRLGGIQPDGRRYANHPPLLVWTATVTTGVLGGRPVGVRLPAVAASLATLVLLAVLLREAGFRPVEAAAGLAAAGTSAMFLTYGAMSDTPVVSLPFGLAVWILAQRAWQGRPPPQAVSVAVAAMAALSGWQAVVAVGLAAAAVRLAPDRAGRSTALHLGTGALAGVAVTLSWIGWVKGTLLDLGDQAGHRSLATAAPWAERNALHLDDLYGPVLLGAVVLGLAVAPWTGLLRRAGDPGSRVGWDGPLPLVVVVAACVGLYTGVFRQASAEHEYWTFWGVALVAVAVAVVARAVGDGAARRPGPARPVVVGVATLALVALVVTGATHRSAAARGIESGLDAVEVLAAVPRARTPEESPLAVRGVHETGAPWANWAVHGRAERPAPDELALLPDDRLLFIHTSGDPTPEVRAVALAAEGRFVLLTAGDYREVVGG